MNKYFNWNDVKSLHIEITALCNAWCPMCPRYVGKTQIQHPDITNDMYWNIEQTKKYLPYDYLTNIESIIINGNFGDFVTNKHALDIVNYLSKSPNNPYITINTNGSARSVNWWKKLAGITKNMTVYFAIDGLENTHTIYRRNTNWHTIIKNATAFIEAGGNAEWVMTIFDHNKYETEECKDLSKKLGFKNIIFRTNKRPNVLIHINDGPILIKAPNSPNTIIHKHFIKFDKKKHAKDKTFILKNSNKDFMNNLNECKSIKLKSVFIDAIWNVTPCCWTGRAIIGPNGDRFSDKQIYSLANKNNIDLLDYIKISETRTICQIVNEGFSWIFNNLLTEDILYECTENCQTNKLY